MTIQEALRYDFERLKKAGIDSYQLDTEILLAKTLFHPKRFITPLASLILRGELNSKIQTFLKYAETIDRRNLLKLPLSQKLTPSQLQIFKTLIEKRQKRIPLAYLTNVKEFYGLPFYVDERVLIPRPQTEELVRRVTQKVKETRKQENITVVDVGTGSGCISISLIKALQQHSVIARKLLTKQSPSLSRYNEIATLPIVARNDIVTFIATDTSAEALAVAKRNARIHGVADRIRFVKTDKIPVIASERIVIVANLPYLNSRDKNSFYKKSPELKYEPANALFAGHQGLEYYETLVEQISKIKKKQIACFFEIEPYHNNAIMKLIKSPNPQSLLSYRGDRITYSISQ